MNKKAMILAAGLGQRMRPLTDNLPKPLISIAGKPILTRTFDHLKNSGIQDIVINTHYLSSLIEEYVRENNPETLISYEKVLLETGGGIKKALPLLGEESFFTLNGDSIWVGSDSLRSMEKMWDETQMDALLLLIPRERAYGYEGRGDFFLTKKGSLVRPEKGEEAPYVYIGVQHIHPRLFHESPEGPFSLNLLWDKALKRGRLYGCVHQGEWFHISIPEDLKVFESIILDLEK